MQLVEGQNFIRPIAVYARKCAQLITKNFFVRREYVVYSMVSWASSWLVKNDFGPRTLRGRENKMSILAHTPTLGQ